MKLHYSPEVSHKYYVHQRLTKEYKALKLNLMWKGLEKLVW